MKYLLLVAVILLMSLTACESEKEEFVQPENVIFYSPLDGSVVTEAEYIRLGGPCDGTWCGDDHAGCCPDAVGRDEDPGDE